MKIRNIKKLIYAVLTGGLLFTLSGCALDNIGTNSGEKEETINLFAMDTIMTISAYGDNAADALALCKTEIEDIESMVSSTIETSEIYKLNETKSLKVSEDVYNLIEDSVYMGDETDGLFDITIYPVMKAWGFTTEEQHVPSDETLAGLLKNVNYKNIILDEAASTVTLPEDSEIELGGITKGYTSAKIADLLKENGVESAIINLGGNVEVVGFKPDGSKWRIGIEDPTGKEEYLLALSVADKAVVTSGGYERYFEEDGVKYHHIIDPRTGYPADSGLISVSIVSSDGTLADGLSTALYIMGYEDAVKYWKENSEKFDMILVDENEDIFVTEGISNDYTSGHEINIISLQ